MASYVASALMACMTRPLAGLLILTCWETGRQGGCHTS